jgi:hypothetical protein
MRRAEHSRQKVFLLVIFLGIVSIGLIFGEMTVRFLGQYDRDGNFLFTFRSINLFIKPFHLPINFTKETIRQYQVRPSYLMYDSTLGWVPRPRSTSEDELYHANEEGIRRGSIDEITRSGKKDLQIVLLGDSYTHGDEVPFEHTWGSFMEKNLAKMGIQADIINLGVPGYGMDQAFLRWKTFGVTFSPDIVIFGFQPETVKRNLNIFRKLYNKWDYIPFSKPRFVLTGNHLKSINSPTVPLEKMVEIYRRFDKWENRKFEYYYRPKDYEDHIWLKSKFLDAVIGGIGHLWDESRDREFYTVDHEPSRLVLTILDELRFDVEHQGAELLVAILIPKWDFHYVRRGHPFPYQGLLEVIEHQYDTVDPSQRLFHHVEDSNFDQVFSRWHYSARGNEIVAEAIGEAITTRTPSY